MVLRKHFVPSYLFSFVVGFFFGVMIDFHEKWVSLLPTAIPLRIGYFFLSYVIISFGIALSNRCQMPIIPTDLFSRELAEITQINYSKIKISFDTLCLIVTACMTFFFLGHIKGLGVGTVFAALTTGKCVEIIGNKLDRHVVFITCK